MVGFRTGYFSRTRYIDLKSKDLVRSTTAPLGLSTDRPERLSEEETGAPSFPPAQRAELGRSAGEAHHALTSARATDQFGARALRLRRRGSPAPGG